jgi:hypothetical protein
MERPTPSFGAYPKRRRREVARTLDRGVSIGYAAVQLALRLSRPDFSRALDARPVIALLTILAIAAATAFPVTSRGQGLRAELRLSPSGLGPIHFGMDQGQAERALGEAITSAEAINTCSFWNIPGAEPGIQMIAFEGRLGYILLYKDGTQTTRGIELGDGARKLRRRYGSLLHPGRSAFPQPGRSLFVDERINGATFALEFDVSHGKVMSIKAGTKQVVDTFYECA